MSKTTKTMREVQNFASVTSGWLEGHPTRSRFSYALGRVVKRLQPEFTRYTEALEDARVEHCQVDEKGGLVMRDDQYVFSRDGMKALNEKVRSLLGELVEFEPYMATDVPDDLTEMEVMAFDGFVLTDSDEEPIRFDPAGSNGHVPDDAEVVV